MMKNLVFLLLSVTTVRAARPAKIFEQNNNLDEKPADREAEATVTEQPEPAAFGFLKTTFPQPPARFDFEHRPTTMAEARANKWTLISSCDMPDPKFTGIRFAEYTSPDDIVLIYDYKGYVAGIQAVVEKIRLIPGIYDYVNDPVYQEGAFFGRQVYFITVYFVEPSTICPSAARDRTKSKCSTRNAGCYEPRNQTADALYIQNGPTSDNTVYVPPAQDDIDLDVEQTGWNELNCFALMGTHYVTYNLDINADCNSFMPVMLLLNQRKLSGFAFVIPTFRLGPNWETIQEQFLTLVFPPQYLPKCHQDITRRFPITAMHVYFGQNLADCSNAKFISPIPVPSPNSEQ